MRALFEPFAGLRRYEQKTQQPQKRQTQEIVATKVQGLPATVARLLVQQRGYYLFGGGVHPFGGRHVYSN